MNRTGTIWQVVPRTPGNREGVGDYAQNLAGRLQDVHGYDSTFVTGSDLAAGRSTGETPNAIVLHYVNYGYQARGVPFRLPSLIERLRGQSGVKLITIFHELYATGNWRQSAFWLQPLQKRIARSLAQCSDACILSSPAMAEQLRQLSPESRIVVRPVLSNFGEPVLSDKQMAGRDAARWIICGGSELVERSLRSFVGLKLPCRELFVVGGADRAEVRQLLRRAGGVTTRYLPNIEADEASEILASCSFGWIAYFEHAHPPTSAILKSTAFAAYCAHGVIPVSPAGGANLALHGDPLPGPFSPENLPAKSDRPEVARAIYNWYGRHASSSRLAATIAAEITS